MALPDQLTALAQLKSDCDKASHHLARVARPAKRMEKSQKEIADTKVKVCNQELKDAIQEVFKTKGKELDLPGKAAEDANTAYEAARDAFQKAKEAEVDTGVTFRAHAMKLTIESDITVHTDKEIEGVGILIERFNWKGKAKKPAQASEEVATILERSAGFHMVTLV